MTWNAYRLGAVVVLAFGLLALLESVRLGMGTLAAPASGLWPSIASAVIVLCGLFLLVEDSRDDYEPWTRRSARIALAVAALASFVIAVPLVGIVPSAFLLLLFWIRVLAGESLRLSLALALVGSVGLYVVFGHLLGVPFPEGIVSRLTGIGSGL